MLAGRIEARCDEVGGLQQRDEEPFVDRVARGPVGPGQARSAAAAVRKLSVRSGSAAVRLATASAKIAPNGRFASSDRT